MVYFWAALLVGLVGLLALRWWLSTAARFRLTVVAPRQVALGERCTIALKVENRATRPLTLDMVSVDDSLAGHFDALHLEPAPTSQAHALGAKAWAYGVQVDPRGSFRITLEGRASKAGPARGQLRAITSQLVGSGQQVRIDVAAS